MFNTWDKVWKMNIFLNLNNLDQLNDLHYIYWNAWIYYLVYYNNYQQEIPISLYALIVSLYNGSGVGKEQEVKTYKYVNFLNVQ